MNRKPTALDWPNALRMIKGGTDVVKAREHLKEVIYDYGYRAVGEDMPELYTEDHNRAKLLLARIGPGKIPRKPHDLVIEKQNEEYSAFVASEQMIFSKPQYPIEALKVLKIENPIILKCFAKCTLFRIKYDYSALPEFAHIYRERIFVKTGDKFACYLEEHGKKCGEGG